MMAPKATVVAASAMNSGRMPWAAKLMTSTGAMAMPIGHPADRLARMPSAGDLSKRRFAQDQRRAASGGCERCT